MIYKPSRINSILAGMPEDFQEEALHVIKKEHDRLERGDYTDEEEKMFSVMEKLGEAAGETIDNLIRKVLKDD